MLYLVNNLKIFILMFNAIIIGNLGRNAELINGRNGNALIKLAVAVNQGKEAKPIWVDVLLNNRPNLMPYLTTGTKVYVQGDVTITMTRDYLNVNVFADKLQLIGDRPPKQENVPGVPSAVPEPDADPFAAPDAVPAAPEIDPVTGGYMG